jgi:hypothetical protein
LEPVAALGTKGVSSTALIADPCSELVAVDRVGVRDAGITMAFDVVQKSGEAFLPLVGVRTPCPAWQLFESVLAVSVKVPFA